MIKGVKHTQLQVYVTTHNADICNTFVNGGMDRGYLTTSCQCKK